MNREEIDQAITQAENAVTRAIREGRTPACADLLLLQRWKRKKTLRNRLRDSAFPLVVVAVAMLVMALMATNRPPVTKFQGHLQTTAVDLQISEAQSVESLYLRGATKVTTFMAFGFAAARLGSCQRDVSNQGVRFQGSGLHLPLSGAERLRLEVTRQPPPAGGRHATVSLLATINTNAVVEAFNVSGAGRPSGFATCPENGILKLVPDGAAEIELAAPQVPAAAFPEFLTMPPISVAQATFGRRDGGALVPTCALKGARLEIRQEIGIIGVSGTKAIEPSKGTCLDLPDGEWRVHLTPGAEGTIDVSFRSSGGAVADIDDGLPANAVTRTYLEILAADPGLALILGAIAFILTTVWSAAAVLKEFVSE